LRRSYVAGVIAPWDRLLAWLATGPLGRLAAFAWDLAGALIGGAVNKLGRR
jgi:hypothetical protein